MAVANDNVTPIRRVAPPREAPSRWLEPWFEAEPAINAEVRARRAPQLPEAV